MSRILIVDDDEDILDCLQVVLEERHDVVTASNGVEAVAKATAMPFDLVVLDLMMPIMDGASVVTELRARDIHVPIVLASAASDLAKRAEALKVDDFICKPFDFDTLDAKIARALEQRERARGER